MARARRPVQRPPLAAGRPAEERLRPGPRARALIAPGAPASAQAPNEPFTYPPRQAAVHGQDIGGDLRLVLPRTTDELTTWGRRLRSCIGSFGPAVASGRSVLVGVERDRALAYCLELTPERTVRQFLGERNGAVPQAVTAAVCARLVVLGMLTADGPANQEWLEA